MAQNSLKWLGQSGWQITTSKGKVLFIDPWLTGNPLAPVKIEDLPAAGFLLLSHDHADHASDAVAVTKKTGATLVGQPETMAIYKEKGAPNTLAMNTGGSIDLDGVQVTMTDAYHTSASGTPAGYILTLEDGKVVYHAGDTCLHANMSTWGELFDIDLALLPIGGRFTMDARQAARALKLLRARAAVPMHYRTFPLLAQSADEFVQRAAQDAPRSKVHVIDPGDEFLL
ncbi:MULTISPECIES: metal-dependent hydrolase [unclassified Mesorhizobium]|uniref:metal-dependent hydrolase n=1 Tax=unclassified Mesorhizobium TaxID=325217 RepID=UPI001129A733|nr:MULTISPECIES: metal-dependent hydrolase [unclassified Mesorhizobium]MBZ9894367.1 metal-dependent hydrolase [Mesorhizobium sp. BR1-1-6]TPM57674.1 metal-dependent hydrolase [Mesorhizobium sp. B2-2-4]TPM65523.1 metal-dependent hydrolase [Mesorhizobium sp. B2-2-1]TPM98498.1 metal-dependent hydrolase [Mesorhizobium sp. B2-1-5]TPN38567.1 metal-dependent hydrolase [Mesorhizobium sp. B1-1-6]